MYLDFAGLMAAMDLDFINPVDYTDEVGWLFCSFSNSARMSGIR